MRSSIRVITPMAISRRSCGVSGHGYSVARNLKPILFILHPSSQSGVPPFADLLDARLELLALEEDDEDALADLRALKDPSTMGLPVSKEGGGAYGGGVLEGLRDLRLAQEDVAAAGAPEQPFEAHQPLPHDHPRHEPATRFPCCFC